MEGAERREDRQKADGERERKEETRQLVNSINKAARGNEEEPIFRWHVSFSFVSRHGRCRRW